MIDTREQAMEEKIRTSFIYPPIPIRQFDWAAWFDGEEEYLTGHGQTEQDAIEDLRQQAADRKKSL